jgi:aspartyl-tRNA(Asn)/glutamyl-tRNA(Gln) amidotransferase subunit B
LAANWVTGELTAALNKGGQEIAQCPVSAEMLGGMIKRIQDNTISGKIAKEVFDAMWNGEGDADTVIEARGLKQITDTGAIEAIIDDIIANNPGQVEQYRGGKDKLFGFFVGQVMKATQGKANPQQVNELLKQKLAG